MKETDFFKKFEQKIAAQSIYHNYPSTDAYIIAALDYYEGYLADIDQRLNPEPS